MQVEYGIGKTAEGPGVSVHLTGHLTKYWIGQATWSDTFRLIPEEKHANPDNA